MEGVNKDDNNLQQFMLLGPNDPSQPCMKSRERHCGQESGHFIMSLVGASNNSVWVIYNLSA